MPSLPVLLRTWLETCLVDMATQLISVRDIFAVATVAFHGLVDVHDELAACMVIASDVSRK